MEVLTLMQFLLLLHIFSIKNLDLIVKTIIFAPVQHFNKRKHFLS